MHSVPHSNSDGSACTVAGQYSTIRAVPAGFALTDSELETLEVPAGTPPQPCDVMAVNNKLSIVKTLYDAGDAAFIANVGPLVEPCTKAEFLAKAKSVPQGRCSAPPLVFSTTPPHLPVLAPPSPYMYAQLPHRPTTHPAQGLFAHNVQQFVTQNVHAGAAFTKGILGK